MEYFNLCVAKYGWRNGCYENPSNVYTTNEEAVLNSILLVSLDNSSTLLFISGNSSLRRKLEIVAGLYSYPCFLHLFIKKKLMDKRWTSSFAGRVSTLTFVTRLPYNSWRRVFRLVAIFFFVLHFLSCLWRPPDSLPMPAIQSSHKTFPNLQGRISRVV